MKKFLIKVNGNKYEVEVEEIRDASFTEAAARTVIDAAPAPVSAPVRSQEPVAAPTPAVTNASAAEEKNAVSNGDVGSVKITAPMPGTVLKVIANPGDSMKKGQVLLILEAMKMENEIVAPSDGTVVSINVTGGTSVNAGELLASLN